MHQCVGKPLSFHHHAGVLTICDSSVYQSQSKQCFTEHNFLQKVESLYTSNYPCYPLPLEGR